MKKILVLGAGNAQIDLINYCHQIGMEVHCLSYSSADPGIKLADHFEQINIIDQEAVERYFRENHMDYIYSVGSDIAVPVFTRVAEHTGTMRFISPECADICCSKRLVRNKFKNKAYNLPYVTGSDLEKIRNAVKDQNFFPAEMKPVDSQGQRGVTTVQSESGLEESFHKAMNKSREGRVILEKFVEGPEVSVNAYVLNGKVILSVLTDRESWPQFPGGVIRRHHIPSRFEGTQTHLRILQMVEDVVREADIQNGPVYFQIMIEDDMPYLIEVTPRLDGCHMWRLIREACGVDLLQMTMDHFLYQDPFHSSQNRLDELTEKGLPCGAVRIQPENTLHLEFFCQAPGEVFDGGRFEALPAIYRTMYYQDGQTVRPINGYMEKCGYRIYRDPQGKAQESENNE